MKRTMRRVALSTAGALGLGLLFWAKANAVDIKGSAFSPVDFKEYRLLIGQGASPTEFSLIARSSVAVRASALGSWTATVDGPYVLALESERLMLETLEGACEQARRRQEDERKSRLKHHEDGARE